MPRTPVIGLIMATELEAEPFPAALGLERIEDRPFPVFARDDLVLVISGIGKAGAAMTTAYCCTRFQPDWICNLGAAGATDDSRGVGTIHHVEKVIETDRPILRTDTPHLHMPEVLPGFATAVLATQDRAVTDPASRRELAPLAGLVDMEGAAVVQASAGFGARCVLFKFVSDTPDRPDHSDIVQRIIACRGAFCDFIAASVIPRLRPEGKE